jgi:phosphopantetheinyl transferase (holo-ACP synthase)
MDGPLAVGNDIVDLEYEQDLDETRFAKRVLSPCEHAEFRRRQDRRQYLWMAWSAKEAAYKYFKQLDGKTAFLPAKYEFCHRTKCVNFGGRTVPVYHRISEEFIYCRAGSELIGEATDRILASLSPMDQHAGVRVLGENMLAAQLHCHIDAISFGKSLDGVPFAMVLGEVVAVSVSFTHHGRYIACATA